MFVHHLISKGTVDERVIQVLSGKATAQDGLMNIVKELINKYKR